MHSADVTGISDDGRVLNVRSTRPEEEYTKADGAMRGYRYEWGINHYSYQNKAIMMEEFNLTQEEYDFWDCKFIHRYNIKTEEWYVAREFETYARLLKV